MKPRVNIELNYYSTEFTFWQDAESVNSIFFPFSILHFQFSISSIQLHLRPQVL